MTTTKPFHHCLIVIFKYIYTNLKVSLNEVVDVKIFIVITPWIEQSFSNLDPTNVTDELNDGEEGHEDDCKKYKTLIKMLRLFKPRFI